MWMGRFVIRGVRNKWRPGLLSNTALSIGQCQKLLRHTSSRPWQCDNVRHRYVTISRDIWQFTTTWTVFIINSPYCGVTPLRQSTVNNSTITLQPLHRHSTIDSRSLITNKSMWKTPSYHRWIAPSPHTGKQRTGVLSVHIHGVSIPLSPSPPQTNSGVGQTIQIHCGKLEPFSAIDLYFKGFCFCQFYYIYGPIFYKKKKCGNSAKQHDFAYRPCHRLLLVISRSNHLNVFTILS